MKKVKKVLFLNPPDPTLLDIKSSPRYNYFEPPLGLLYVYDYVKKNGNVGVEFLDLNIEMKFKKTSSLEEIIHEQLAKSAVDMVAVATLYYTGIEVFHTVAEYIKAFDRKIFVVFGGHYPHHLTKMCLTDVNVDYGILSEGEMGLCALIEALNNEVPLSTIEGVAYRSGGEIVKQPRRNFWQGYEMHPRLPWEDTDFGYYFKDGRNLLHRIKPRQELKLVAITASRGCPNACTFCTSPSFWNRRWRKRRVEHIVGEIEFLKKHYGVNTIIFNDENIGVNKKWFIALLDALIPLRINWISSGGLSLRTINDEQVIEKMYDSGIGFFNLAVESGGDDVLANIKKPLTIAESVETVELIRKHGDAFINAFFITGFPFEKWDSVQRTLAFAESLDTDWKGFYCFRPLPGAQLYQDCIDQGLIDGFRPNYGELYFAQEIEHIDYTSQELERANYLANLKNNFINNRNLRLATPVSLAQAERDFSYVLEIAPSHVFAYLGLAKVYEKRKDMDTGRRYLQAAREAMHEESFDWRYYLEQLHIELD